MNRAQRRASAAIERRRERRGKGEKMSDENKQAEVPAAFQAFVQRVAQLGAEHGMQAVVVAAAVPGNGGHGPSTVHGLSWSYGQPSAEWRTGAARGLGEVAIKAAAGMMPPAETVTGSAAASEGGDAPAVAPTEAA